MLQTVHHVYKISFCLAAGSIIDMRGEYMRVSMGAGGMGGQTPFGHVLWHVTKSDKKCNSDSDHYGNAGVSAGTESLRCRGPEGGVLLLPGCCTTVCVSQED